MIVRIARQEAIDKYPNLPLRKWNSKEEEFDEHFPETYSSYVLTLPSKSFRGHVKSLGLELSRLIGHLGFEGLIFLGDMDAAWLKREHDYKPAKEALQYLKDHKIGKRFNGALQVDTTQLPEFIIHLSWLVRTNTVLADVHFIDTGQNIVGSICQYGNLHVSTLNGSADSSFKNAIPNTKFEFLTANRCFEKFSKSGAIRGRRLN